MGAYVQNLRQAQKRGQLDSEMVSILEELPGWTTDVHEAAWEEGFAALLRFKEREGHAQPRHKEREPESDYPIGNWVFTQRGQQRTKKLRLDRQKRLAEIPDWSWDPHEDKWQYGFSHLFEYESTFETTAVPVKAKSPDGYPIGTWASKQRRDGKAGRLDPARVAQLDGIGFIWDTR